MLPTDKPESDPRPASSAHPAEPKSVSGWLIVAAVLLVVGLVVLFAH